MAHRCPLPRTNLQESRPQCLPRSWKRMPALPSRSDLNMYHSLRQQAISEMFILLSTRPPGWPDSVALLGGGGVALFLAATVSLAMIMGIIREPGFPVLDVALFEDRDGTTVMDAIRNAHSYMRRLSQEYEIYRSGCPAGSSHHANQEVRTRTSFAEPWLRRGRPQNRLTAHRSLRRHRESYLPVAM